MREFLKTTRATGGFLGDYINDAGGKKRVYLQDVIGAIVPPKGDQPGYYLIMGILFEQTVHGLFKLLWMGEYTSAMHNDLVAKLHDDAVRLMATKIYAADTAEDKSFFVKLYRFNSKNRAKWMLRPAPSPDNELYGQSLLYEYVHDQAIERPADSLYATEITEIDEDVNLSDPKFYVFHAIRYLLAGIERDLKPDESAYYDIEAYRFYKPESRHEEKRSRAHGAMI